MAFARKHRTPLFATEGTFHRLKDRTADKYKKVEWLRLKADRSLKLAKMVVDIFPTPHDAAEPVGFAFRQGQLRFSHVTDIGHLSPRWKKRSEDRRHFSWSPITTWTCFAKDPTPTP